MENKSYLRQEFGYFKGSFKLDKRFGFVIMWEVLLFILLAIGLFLWASQMEKLLPLLQQASNAMNAPLSIQSLNMPSVEQVEQLQTRMTTYIVLFAIYLLVVWPLMKCLSYLALLGKRISKAFYWRFLTAEICWTALMVLVVYLLQLVFYKTLFTSLPYSAASRITLLFGSVISFVLLCYLTMTFFITLTKAGKIKEGLKGFVAVPIKGIKSFILPIIFAFLIFILLNILMYWCGKLEKNVGLVVNTLLLIVYLTWLKLYYSSCIERLGKHKHEEHKPKSKVIKHSVRKQ